MNITVSEQHDKSRITTKENCQLFVAITGTKEYIIAELKSLIDECNSDYGKPRQGIMMKANGSIDIITPVWNGEKY